MMCQSVHIFERPQNVVMVDEHVVIAGLDHGPIKDRGDVGTSFVPRDDEQTVVRLRQFA